MAVAPASHVSALPSVAQAQRWEGPRSRVSDVSAEPAPEQTALNDQEPITRTRHSRRHIQQTLRHLERIVRHALKDSLKAADDLDKQSVKEIRRLSQQYRHDLRDVFLDAGRGNEFDPASILEGLAVATREFTEGLRALRGELPVEEPDQPVVDPITPKDPAPEIEPEVTLGFSSYA